MRNILAALTLCLIATTAEATDLQGRWEITAPSHPDLSGDLLIDAEGRAVYAATSITRGRSYRARGYVSRLTDTKAEITLADADKAPVRMRCVIQSPDVLNCDDMEHSGSTSSLYYLRRIGPGPVSLLPQ